MTHAFGKTNVPKSAPGVARVIDAVRCSDQAEGTRPYRVEHGRYDASLPGNVKPVKQRRWPNYSQSDVIRTPHGWTIIDTAPGDDPRFRPGSPEQDRLIRELDAIAREARQRRLRAERRALMSDVCKGLFMVGVMSAAMWAIYLWPETIASSARAVASYLPW